MAQAIRVIHWSDVDAALPRWAPAPGRVRAAWPAPVNADACFAAAGFSDFADCELDWDEEFSALTTALVSELTAVAGAPLLLTGPNELARQGWMNRLLGNFAKSSRPGPSLSEMLEAPARNDQYPQCILQFGASPTRTALLRTSDGHPIWWLWTSESTSDEFGLESMLRTIAQGRPVEHALIDWRHLTCAG